MEMNGASTKEYFHIIPLGSYDCLIGMNWLEKHHVILDYYNKDFTFLDEEGKLRKNQSVLRAVTIREISALQLKKSFRKGCNAYGRYT
jgi:hypothetical protein